MAPSTTSSVAELPGPAVRDCAPPRLVRPAALLTGILATSWLAVSVVDADSRVPLMWPAAGLMAGLFLTSSRGRRHWTAAVSVALVLAAHLAHGYDPRMAAAFAVTTVTACLVVRRRLVAGLDGRRAALLDQGDVSRLIGAIAAGSLVAGVGYGLADWWIGAGNPLLGALGAFGGHAASLMVLLPLFMETLRFDPLAGSRERLVQGVITLGVSAVLFSTGGSPPIIFAVMPMFAWHAYRGTLRESTVLLTVVGAMGTVLTMVGTGPIHRLGQLYDIAPELASGVLQLFLLDCGLILLPLSVLVTQQRMAAVRADSERETLERLVASARGTAIIATGRDGRIVLFNPGAEEMLGYRAAEVLGELPDGLHDEDELRRQATALRSLPNFADICRASTEQGDDRRLWRFRHANGAERTLRMTLSPVLDDRGEPSGYLATAEDVTEREAARESLETSLAHEREALERVTELERIKGNFVATVSHELRTPITSIVGYTEILEDGMAGDLTDSQLSMVAKIDRNGRRMLNLVEDLLTLSEVESSRLTIEPEPLDLRQVVERARQSLTPTLAGRRLALALDLPGEPAQQYGDPKHLERMVAGLLSNAVKFTPDGGAIEVVVRSFAGGSELVVRDTGVGIAPEETQEVFERFAKTRQATADESQGTGLGLTIIRAIVSLHGGEVSIDSTLDRGTTVTVLLPRAQSLGDLANGVASAEVASVLERQEARAERAALTKATVPDEDDDRPLAPVTRLRGVTEAAG
ncbi:MAG: domain S-box protein [Marmoricola sp.]|nr:domain S-box protein [Marmoricola sp.]